MLRVSASNRAKTCSATLSEFAPGVTETGNPPGRRGGEIHRVVAGAGAGDGRNRGAPAIISAVIGAPQASRASEFGRVESRSSSLNLPVPGGSIGVNPAASRISR